MEIIIKSPIDIKAIDHVVLRASNAQALVAFYCEVLGCSIERELPEETGLTQLRAGSGLIDIIALESKLGKLGGEGPGREGHNMDHLCLAIESIDEKSLIDFLKSNNVHCGEVSERYGAGGFGRSVYLKDLEGNTIELKLMPVC